MLGAESPQPLSAPREEGLEGGLVALLDQLPPPLGGALLVEQVRVERRVTQGVALLGGDGVLEQIVDRRQGVSDRLLCRALDQTGQLDQLQEPRHRPRHVDVGIQAGLPGLSRRPPPPPPASRRRRYPGGARGACRRPATPPPGPRPESSDRSPVAPRRARTAPRP